MKGAKNIGVSFAKPKLKASKMSFIRAKKAEAIKAENLKGPETVSTESAATTLTETNRILAQIQNQLAIDFASRIAEKRQTLKLSRKTVRKKKLGEKEEFVERGKKLKESSKSFGEKILSPVKSIFDKLINFLTLVGAGIALNAAFEWLSDDENRKKLVRVFTFLKDHWKKIFAIVVGAKILGLLLKLRALFSLGRSLGRRLSNLFGKNGKFKPGGPDFCRGVVACVLNNLPQIVSAIAASVLFLNLFKPKLNIPDRGPIPNPDPVPVPTPPAPGGGGGQQPIEQPVEQPIGTAPGDDLFNYQVPDFIKFFSEIPRPDYTNALSDKYNEILTILSVFGPALGVGALSAIPGISNLIKSPVKAPPVQTPGPGRPGKQFGPNNPDGTINPGRLLNQPTTAKPTPSKSSTRIPYDSPIAKTELFKVIRQQYTNLRYQGLSVEDATAKIMRQFGKTDVLEALSKGSIGLSGGGTIPGKGPENVDSVSAMLAPGEEVIKTSSANIFRPVLKDINNNAGRLFLAFKNGVEQQARNLGLQQEETNRSISLFKEFSDLIKKQIMILNKEKIEEDGGFMTLLLSTFGSRRQNPNIRVSNTTNVGSDNDNDNNIQLLNHVNNLNNDVGDEDAINARTRALIEEDRRLSGIKPKPRRELDVYGLHRNNNKNTGEGSTHILNMNVPGQVIDARRQEMAQPTEQPTESSSSNIIIAPTDPDNPFFGRTFSAYGIE